MTRSYFSAEQARVFGVQVGSALFVFDLELICTSIGLKHFALGRVEISFCLSKNSIVIVDQLQQIFIDEGKVLLMLGDRSKVSNLDLNKKVSTN